MVGNLEARIQRIVRNARQLLVRADDCDSLPFPRATVMKTIHAAGYLLWLSLLVTGCEENKAPPPPARTPVTPAVEPPDTAPALSAVSSGKSPETKHRPVEKLMDGAGLGKVIALHDGYVYWTTQAGIGSSSSDGKIIRLPVDGGIPQEVAGGLDNITSLAFGDGNVFWTMCGTIEHVQRCRITQTPTSGGKRNLVFDAGPNQVAYAVWTGAHLLWAEATNKSVMKTDTKQPKPAALTATGDVTSMVSRDNDIFWSEGRALAPDGAIMRSSLSGPALAVSKGRRFPRHLLVDGDRLIWVENSETEAGSVLHAIMTVEATGGEPKTIVKDLSHVEGIAVGGTKLLIMTSDTLTYVPKTGGESAVLVADLKSPAGPVATESHAYWISNDKIWRISLQP